MMIENRGSKIALLHPQSFIFGRIGASSRKKRIFSFVLLLRLSPLIFSITGCDLPFNLPLGDIFRPTPQQTEITPGQLLTIDGYDPGTGVLVLRIPLRKDPDSPPSGVIATLNHGESIKFVRREGDSVLVDAKDEKRGWVASQFIKELK